MELTITWYWHDEPSSGAGYVADEIEIENYDGPVPRIGETMFRPDGAKQLEGEPDDGQWIIDEVWWQLTETLEWQVFVNCKPKSP